MSAQILGRAWIYDTGDPVYIECWEHELEPMTSGRRGGANWAHEHFGECCSEGDLRRMFGLPETGNFQVLFKGTMSAWRCNSPMDPEEWDQEFEVSECRFEEIPPEYLSVRTEQ